MRRRIVLVVILAALVGLILCLKSYVEFLGRQTPDALRALDDQPTFRHLLWGSAKQQRIGFLLFGGLALSLFPRFWSGVRLSWYCSAGLAFAMIVVVGSQLRSIPVRPIEHQVVPDSLHYVDGAINLVAGKGLVTTSESKEAKPLRYPPGYSLALVPFVLANDSFPANVNRGNKFYAILAVCAAWAVAWRLGGPLAAAFVGAFLASASFSERHVSYIMSDCLGATCTLAIAGLLHKPTARGLTIASLIAGASVLLRLTAVLNIVALALAMPRASRRLLLWAVPGVAALAIHQWVTFGLPWKTGYDYHLPHIKNFAWHYASHPRGVPGDFPAMMVDGDGLGGDQLKGKLVSMLAPQWDGDPTRNLPNFLFYPAMVLGLFWYFSPPLTPLLGLIGASMTFRSPASRYTLALVLGTVIFQIFYFYQAVRFLAPVGFLLATFAAVGIAKTIDWLTILMDTDQSSPRLTENPTDQPLPQAA